MKLFVRGSLGLFAALFASILIFNSPPLFAETQPSPGPAQQEQQEKKEPAGTTKEKQPAPAAAASETGELAATVPGTPRAAVKDEDLMAAPSVKLAGPVE